MAYHANDVDLVLVNGYGFLRRQGGPVWWARQRGREVLREDLTWLAQASGPGFQVCDPDVLWNEEKA